MLNDLTIKAVYRCGDLEGHSTIPVLKMERESFSDNLEVKWCHSPEHHNPDDFF